MKKIELLSSVNWMAACLFIIIPSLLGCQKLVEVGPPQTQLSRETVFKNDATATAALLSIYAQMASQGLSYYIPVYTGLSADELVNHSPAPDYIDFHTNNLTSSNGQVQSLWVMLYKFVYQANAVVEGAEASGNLSESVKKQIIGEAKFIRAFCNFYLLHLFGEIPLVVSTDYRTNAVSGREKATVIYQQLVKDLTEAKESLGSDYVSASNGVTTERVRPNKWTAAALLARVYLFRKEWANAEVQASAVIERPSQYALEEDLNQVFVKSSKESIWNLMPVVPKFNSYEGAYFILTAQPSLTSISQQLVDSFEPEDRRRTQWINSISVQGQVYYYPYKYKVPQNAATVTEYSVSLRLAELFLVRAEARAELGNLEGALEDVNRLRVRAGLEKLDLTTKEDVVEAIVTERKMELFTEFGHRWLDLKRLNRVSELARIKGSNWQTTDQLYPIPQSEINANGNLTQNAGY